MKKVMVVYCVLGVVFLSGCSEEVKTPKWFLDHPKELAEVYADCEKSGSASENCESSRRAHASSEASKALKGLLQKK
ncbi:MULTISPECIES: EexN family lipoprotein [Pseudomonas syringae group]|uniref:EexN family lipoprotein n=1 Tax=Pseudomonas syringae group TaxID=136849 RepID=UPI0009B257AD|nr:EexN family lipoprotein [Pseudomonas syringae]